MSGFGDDRVQGIWTDSGKVSGFGLKGVPQNGLPLKTIYGPCEDQLEKSHMAI